MGVITISLNEETEKLLRTIAKARFANAKGKIARAITDALNEWAEKDEQEKINKNALKLLEEGFNMGGIISKKREDLHKR